MRFPAAVLVLLTVLAGCGGDEAAETTSTTAVTPTTTTTTPAPHGTGGAPWGLQGIAMPDVPAAVEAVFAALPAEIGGQARADLPGRVEGALEVEYGTVASLRATPVAALPNVDPGASALDWLNIMAGGMEGQEQSDLDAGSDLAWVTSTEQGDGETFYLAAWCRPDGGWYFDVAAATPDGRREAVLAFIAAVG